MWVESELPRRDHQRNVMIATINTKLSLLEVWQARETLAKWSSSNALTEKLWHLSFIKFCWGGVSQRTALERKLVRLGGGAGRKGRARIGKILQVSWVSEGFDRLGKAVVKMSVVLSFLKTGISWAVVEIVCFANCGFWVFFLFFKLWYL